MDLGCNESWEAMSYLVVAFVAFCAGFFLSSAFAVSRRGDEDAY